MRHFSTGACRYLEGRDSDTCCFSLERRSHLHVEHKAIQRATGRSRLAVEASVQAQFARLEDAAQEVYVQRKEATVLAEARVQS